MLRTGSKSGWEKGAVSGSSPGTKDSAEKESVGSSSGSHEVKMDSEDGELAGSNSAG